VDGSCLDRAAGIVGGMCEVCVACLCAVCTLVCHMYAVAASSGGVVYTGVVIGGMGTSTYGTGQATG
jgi:hypothetical protein